MAKWDLIQTQIPTIRDMAREGNSEKEIITYLKISSATFYKLKKEHIELQQALIEGYTYSLQAVEAALYKSALGYEYEEITQERDVKSGSMEITKKVKKEVQPNVSAIMNILTNRVPDRWQNSSKIDISGKIEQEKAFELLPSDDVSKLAKSLLHKDIGGDADED